jgi:DNA (cytosine-5)-methyltransferase 1
VNELSLFTGAGGGIWGSKLLGWETVGYVESDEYCQRVIRQRIREGFFSDAPIFNDVRAFDGLPYRGRVDIVSAGFPCQPFSIAGKRLGEKDDRNMWPETIRVIREVRPRVCLLENVPTLFRDRYFGTILTDLETSGYERISCRIISAAEFGAPHIRKRLWVLAEHTDSNRLQAKIPNAPRDKIPDNRRALWWKGERGISRVDDGATDWIDRVKVIGNAQCPRVVQAAWEMMRND